MKVHITPKEYETGGFTGSKSASTNPNFHITPDQLGSSLYINIQLSFKQQQNKTKNKQLPSPAKKKKKNRKRVFHRKLKALVYVLLIFSVTPFKIDKNQNQIRPIDKVHNPGKERTQQFFLNKICMDNFRQSYRDLNGDAMLVPIRMGTNMAPGNQQKHPSFATNA